MPNKDFLEHHPLYRKAKLDNLPSTADNLLKVKINMYCPRCKSDQTFVMQNEYWETYDHINFPIRGQVLRLFYVCAHCTTFARYFFVRVDENNKYIMKVGQYPPWDISLDPDIAKFLGDHVDLYKKGLICESQGYGIAAFAYYRRIVEEVIGELLEEITQLLSGEDQNKFMRALEETRKTTVAQDKIALVKDLLPPILRPQGMNPLAELHSTLSKGIHDKSDDDCLQLAMTIREVLIFLVNQATASKEASKTFTNGMRKLLERKSKTTS